MKKVLSLILVLAMALTMMSVAAFAAAPSKTADPEVTTDVPGAVITVVKDELVADELEKLTAAASASEYFGVEVEGEVVELFALDCSGLEAAEGDVTVKVAAPAALEEGAAVTAMIGLVSQGNIDWNAFEGAVEDNVVVLTVSDEFAQAMNDAESVLMAIVA